MTQAFLTPSQMNTALAKKLKAVLELTLEEESRFADLMQRLRALEAAYPPPPAPGPPPKADKDDNETPGGHASSVASPLAVLAKDDKYAARGVQYIKDQGGRGVYQAFDHLDAVKSISKEDRDGVKAAARFPGGPAQNFNLAFNMEYPYIWRAHHILPGSAFYYEAADGPCFRPEHFEILLQTDYNINGGHNVILLPFEMWAVLVHALIQHPSDHPKYTQVVMARLKDVAKDLDALIAEKQHDQAKKDFAQALFNAEDDFWDTLVKLGRSVTKGLITGERFQSELVKYSTKSGKAQGALA